MMSVLTLTVMEIQNTVKRMDEVFHIILDPCYALWVTGYEVYTARYFQYNLPLQQREDNKCKINSPIFSCLDIAVNMLHQRANLIFS